MPDDDVKRAFDYSEAAIGLLKRGGIPPLPQYYEVLYTYASGTNPHLNARINEIFRRGDMPGMSLADQLCAEFAKVDASDRISKVSAQMNERLDAVHQAIDDAMSNASSYSGSLAAASGDLQSDLSPQELQSLVVKLMAETRDMQSVNMRLESQLQVSREDIAVLQRDLDDVRRESLTDQLTNIANRKNFDNTLDAAVKRAHLEERPLALLLIDIDHFKKFNDTYGHQTGDQVLRLVAMTLKANVKNRDTAARYGGEEFAAILPATNLRGAKALAEQLRMAVHGKELLKRSTQEKLGRITVSIGVATLRRDDTPQSIVERADQCLYAAKGAGRDCVIGEDTLRKTVAA
ncbi:GGDEF domain-containing protein [Devosia pacifica]|uniref:diguanylate cyclase n=1 Tax=Devosia pacifica TaxID=1335967 RepID=A0A918VME7_9HYPH|nr:GGDEF domain-containing protein [Devosia pacifica]GHA10370.1 GGDEF domain-containing protein [Devosia pacifica]